MLNLESLIEEWTISWAIKLLEWYAQTFMVLISPYMLLLQFELLVVIYLVIQVINLLFPAFRRLTIAIFLPFRVLHVWFHLEAAKKLDLQADTPDKYLVGTHFFTSIAGDDRVSLGIKTPKNTKDAYQIATAPTKGAIILITLSFIISPILLLFGIIGLIIHLYVLLGSITTLWSDSKDYLFAYQVAVLNADLNPRYLGWAVVIFVLTFLSTLMINFDLFQALLLAIGCTIIYLLSLLWSVSRIARKDRKTHLTKERSLNIETNSFLPFPKIKLS